jgi:hypothetical protein
MVRARELHFLTTHVEFSSNQPSSRQTVQSEDSGCDCTLNRQRKKVPVIHGGQRETEPNFEVCVILIDQ